MDKYCDEQSSSRVGACIRGRLASLVIIGVMSLLAPACGVRTAPRVDDPEPTVPGEEDRWPGPAVLPASNIVDAYRKEPGRHIRFEHYLLEEGLSQSAVHDVVQDRIGFMWIATEDGLNRFDGAAFEVYRSDPEDPNSLSGNITSDLYVDHLGMLWIGTYRNGLNRLNPASKQFTRYVHDPANPNSLSDDEVTAIVQDQSGILWIGTNAGLNRFDPETHTWNHYRSSADDPDSLSSDTVLSMLEDSSGVLWIGTGVGLDRMDRDDGGFTHFKNDPADRTSLRGTGVISILEDSSGTIWVGTANGGLNRFNPQDETFDHYLHDPEDDGTLASDYVNAIFEDAWGILWVGTNQGLNWFDQQSHSFVRQKHNPDVSHSLRDDNVLCISGDRSGGLWIGTAYRGLSRYDRRSEQFALIQSVPNQGNSLSHNFVWSIVQGREGELWFGTNGEGLDRFDRDLGRWTHYRHDPEDPDSLSHDTVTAVHEDGEGILWVGTGGGGLNRFDPAEGRFRHYRHDPTDPSSISSDVVFLIHEDHQGDLWVGTIDGLNKLDRDTGRFTRLLHNPDDPSSISDDVIGGAIYEDQSGFLWVGTQKGLNKFDRNTGMFTRYLHERENPQSLGHDIVFSVLQDSSGVLWIGTFGGGLDRLDPQSDTFTHYRVADGLPNDSVYGILEDADGYLWLSTNNGLSRFDPRTETFQNFDSSDGLQGREFNFNAYYESPDGEMFFGGINGVNAFYPDRIVANPSVPPIVLTSISQGGEPVALEGDFPYASEVTFRWPDNYFDFEFAALDFFEPDKHKHAYMLEGFEEDWNHIGARRFGRYTNLPGGTYTLKLKGSNNDGLWNEEGASLHLTIEPPLWEAAWLRILVVVTLAAAVILGYQIRVRRIEARGRELEDQVSERTQALEEKTRQLQVRTREGERQRAELAALDRADEELHRFLDLEQVLQTLVDTAVELLQADKGSLLIWDDQRERLLPAASTGFGKETLDRVSIVAGEGIAGIVAETGQLMAIEDVEADERVTQEIVKAEGIQSFMQVPITVGDQVFGVFSADYCRPRSFEEREKRLLASLARKAAMAIENARLFEDTKSQLEQLTALEKTIQAIASTLESDRLLSLIVQQAMTLLRATGGILNLVDWERGEDQVVAADGEAAFMVGQRSSLEGSLSGWVALHNQPVATNQLQTDSRVDETAVSWIRSAQVTRAAAVPLAIKGKVIGTLIMTGAQEGRGDYEQTDLDILVAFGNQAAIAIENARLYEQAQQLGIVEERQRLARELHDSVTQALYGMTLYAEAMARHLAAEKLDLAKVQLSELRSTAQEALREMRLLIFQLRPPDLEEDGLVAVLRNRLEAVEARAGIKIEFTVPTEARLPIEIEEGLYRIAHEALNNALKHAEASKVSVTLVITTDTVQLEVADDGIGFDFEAGLKEGGLGLEGMMERAEALGGQLIVETKPGAGSSISVEVPR